MKVKYLRARQSYCLYTDDVHLYVFPFNRRRTESGRRIDSGFTVKHRRKDGLWRHYTIRCLLRSEESLIIHAEAVTHLSRSVKSERVYRSKRYVRFKVCI